MDQNKCITFVILALITGFTILTTGAAVSYNLGPKPAQVVYSCQPVAR